MAIDGHTMPVVRKCDEYRTRIAIGEARFEKKLVAFDPRCKNTLLKKDHHPLKHCSRT